ncbi:MAG: hypothetical protein IT243_05090 [Bacteroidia bacterium]|nr:hypothetical protein [Bacteroidia bacterium]
MSNKITDKELENLLKQNNNKEFKPFFSTRVLAKIEKNYSTPIIGNIVANRLYLQRYLVAACILFLLIFAFSVYQEGSFSIEHLVGLGSFSEEDIINYVNPLI